MRLLTTCALLSVLPASAQAFTDTSPLAVNATRRLLAAPHNPRTFNLLADRRVGTVSLKLPAGLVPLPLPDGKVSSSLMIRRTDVAPNLGLNVDVKVVPSLNTFMTTGRVTTTRRGQQTVSVIRYASSNVSLRVARPLTADLELHCHADVDTRGLPADLREQAVARADAVCSSLTMKGWKN